MRPLLCGLQLWLSDAQVPPVAGSARRDDGQDIRRTHAHCPTGWYRPVSDELRRKEVVYFYWI